MTGWLHTGDLGIADEDGWLTIVDRVKELIKYKGLQVAPAELEAILMTHPQVADCAVIGVPDQEAGEVPKAFVVPAGDDFDAKAVLAFVAGQVAPYKRIRAHRARAGNPQVAIGEGPQAPAPLS